MIGMAGALLAGSGCDKSEDGSSEPAAATEEQARHGLTPEQAAEVLVKVGETTITVGDFADRLAEKSPYLRARYSSPERRRELLQEMVKFELLAAEASKRGMDKRDDVVRTRKQVMIQQMMKTEFEDKVKLSDITDKEIEEYYNSHPEEFNKPEQVRASHILVKDQAKAKRLLGKITGAERNNKLFREMARENSEDLASRQAAGDLAFFSRPAERREGEREVPTSVAEAAFALEKIGDVAPALVKSDQGFHIVKLTGKRKALSRTLDHARRPIQHKLWRKRREEAIESFVTGLRESAKPETNWDLLKEVKVAPASPLPGPPKQQAPTP